MFFDFNLSTGKWRISMKIMWGIYVIIGLAAFILSFSIEGYVFSKISDMYMISFIFAAIFEGAKVMTIIMHRFQSEKNEHRIKQGFRVGIKGYQVMLFVVSIGCSIALLANFLDKPNFDEVLLADKKMIENNYKENEKSLHKESEQNISNLKNTKNEIARKYKDRYLRLVEYYEPRIEKEESMRDSEFDNIINNVRKGVKWNEHNRKAEQLTNKYLNEQKKLRDEEDQEIKLKEDGIKLYYSKKSDDLRTERERSLAGLEEKLDADIRTHNQMILSLTSTLKKGFAITVKYDFLVVLFAIITASLLESTIYIIFNYLSITHQEIFALKQDLFIETEKYRTNTENELHKDNIKFASRKNRIKNQMGNLKDNIFKFKRDEQPA